MTGNVINFETLRRHQRERMEAKLLADLEDAGRAHAEAVEQAAQRWRDYKTRTGDKSATGEQVLGLAALSDCREAGARLRAAREAFATSGVPLPAGPEIEIETASDDSPAA